MVGEFDRRTVVAAGLASLTAGCADRCKISALGPVYADKMAIGDAHAHLFNAADLPVAGFLRQVLLPNHLSGLERLWPALIHLGGFLKTLAVDASEEMLRLSPPWGEGEGESGALSVRQFADRAVDELERQIALAGTTAVADLENGDLTIGRSCAELARLLDYTRRATGGQGSTSRDPSAPPRDLRSLVARIASEGAAILPSRRAQLEVLAEFEGRPVAEGSELLERLYAGIAWLYVLLQPRCAHVRKYLATINEDTRQLRRVVNLLVDYDAWLDDRPSPGSEIEAQLRFWTAYGRAAAARLKVENFAPFDPLRALEDELQNGAQATYFAQLENWAAGTEASDIQISGFKLYPPMGFKAIGNRAEPPLERAGGVIRRRWASHNPPWPIEGFARGIEAALDRFFGLCVKHRLPVLAHSNDSNEASLGAGAFANPQFWLDRSKAAGGKLSICLGHFDLRRWGFETYRKVLGSNSDANAPSRIYIDMSYSDRLLSGDGAALLLEIAQLCEAADTKCEWFLFGSDWIMLGQEPHAAAYLVNLLEAAKGIPFWEGEVGKRRMENLLFNNLGRFLDRSGLQAI